jgi:thiol-disulfide isomerase/thioredoxin
MEPNQNQTKFMRLLRFFAAIGLIPFFLSAPATAESTIKVEKMTFHELNRLITQGDCNCLMVFMAAWCGPCREELPDLDRLYRRYGDRGVRFIGVSVDSGGSTAIEAVIREKKVTFPVFWVGETAVDELQIFGIPMIFMIKSGRIVEKIPGKCSYEFLETKILDFLKP